MFPHYRGLCILGILLGLCASGQSLEAAPPFRAHFPHPVMPVPPRAITPATTASFSAFANRHFLSTPPSFNANNNRNFQPTPASFNAIANRHLQHRQDIASRIFFNNGNIQGVRGTIGQINYPFPLTGYGYGNYYNPYSYSSGFYSYPYGSYGSSGYGYSPYSSYGSSGYSPYSSYGSNGSSYGSSGGNYQSAPQSSGYGNGNYNPYAGGGIGAYAENPKPKADPALAAFGIPNSDGQVKWPLAFRLMTPEKKELLQKLEGQLQVVAAQSVAGKVNPRMLDAANQNVETLQQWLRDHQARMADSTFREGQLFLRKIGDGLKAMDS